MEDYIFVSGSRSLTNEKHTFFAKVIPFHYKHVPFFFFDKEKQGGIGKEVSVSMKATHDKYQLLPDSAKLTIYCIESDCLHTKFTEICNSRQVT